MNKINSTKIQEKRPPLPEWKHLTPKYVARLLNATKYRGYWMARCPAHKDNNPSLEIRKDPKTGTLLLKCHAGCSFEDVIYAIELKWCEKKGLIETGERSALEEFSKFKKLPVDFLQKHHVCEERGRVVFKYIPESGREEEAVKRYRGRDGDKARFWWEKEARIMLYGLWLLKNYKKTDPLFIVEGESDALTMWYAGYNALGVPGIRSWKDEWAELIADFRHVIVIVEPKSKGELFERVKKSIPHADYFDFEKLGYKDPSDAYTKTGLDGFRKIMTTIINQDLSHIAEKQTHQEGTNNQQYYKGHKQYEISVNQEGFNKRQYIPVNQEYLNQESLNQESPNQEKSISLNQEYLNQEQFFSFSSPFLINKDKSPFLINRDNSLIKKAPFLIDKDKLLTSHDSNQNTTIQTKPLHRNSQDEATESTPDIHQKARTLAKFIHTIMNSLGGKPLGPVSLSVRCPKSECGKNSWMIVFCDETDLLIRCLQCGSQEMLSLELNQGLVEELLQKVKLLEKVFEVIPRHETASCGWAE